MKTLQKYPPSFLLVFTLFAVAMQTFVVEARSPYPVNATNTITYYVSISGSDSNPGTQAKPWRTIQKAANSAPSGAVIEVGAGNYGENVSISRGSLTFRANGKVITRSIFISSNNISISGFEITGASGHGLNVYGKNVVVESNIVHGNSLGNSANGKCNTTSGGSWQSGLKLSVGADNVTIRNNRVFNNCGEGIAVTRGINSVVENNIVYDNFSANIYLDNSRDITVRSNTVTCSDINMRDGSRAKGIYLGAEYYAGWGNQRQNNYVLQNNITGCEYGIVLSDGYDAGLTSNITIDANIIPSGTYRSISILTSKNQNVVVKNNLIFNAIYVSNPTGVTLINNQIGIPSYTLSGNAGMAGVVLNYVNSGAKSVTADGSGNYSITVPYGWTGTVTPSMAGYGFIPSKRTYSSVTGNRSQENYTPMLLPGAFGKTSPADTATGQSLSPTLSWQTSSGATSYEYCYSSAPGPCTQWRSVGGNTSVTLNGLAPGYTYHWQVRAVNAGGATEANGGSWMMFTTAAITTCSWTPYTPPPSPTFLDVPLSVGHWDWVERLSNAGITTGCGSGNYCPFNEVVRAQMAIFLLRGKHCGNTYTPPPVGSSTGFADVPVSASYAPWVKQLAAEGITAGCSSDNFCPSKAVNRAQMAIFLLRAKHGATYSPPGVGSSTGFGDVLTTATYAPWVKQLAADGITTGCGGGNFCPLQNVNRAQMATFLVRAFGLP